jgi:hypothetical protein
MRENSAACSVIAHNKGSNRTAREKIIAAVLFQ